MPFPSTVFGLPTWVVIAAVACVLALVRDRWLEAQARTVVERWAMQHRYRLVRCRRGWFPSLLTSVSPAYDASGIERRRHAYVFEVTVEDRALGGTSRGRVLVRGTVIGGFDPDVEVSWHSLNSVS